MTRSRPAEGDDLHVVPLRQAVWAWFLISLQTFGGPAGQIAVMQRSLVDERRWIGERRFMHALSYCMLLPGPEAQQLAIYTGWLLNGGIGGLVAGVLFVLPGAVAMLALSWAYVAHGETTFVTGLFLGLAPAVIAIVVQALIRLGRRALLNRVLVGLAVAAFLCLAVFGLAFPLVVIGAGVVGWLIAIPRPELMRTQGEEAVDDDRPEPLVPDSALHHAQPGAARNVLILSVGLVLWVAPVVVAYVLAGGEQSVFVDQGLFFGGMALVTFGGAYAVLTYVAQAAVETYGWVTPTEMVRGLALAETTPGPLIMVVQFVAFLGAYRDPGSLNPWVAAVLASMLTVWVTFVPCFLFIFVGAPYVERLRHNTSLAAALTGVMAAIVGVIANLAFYFTVYTLFAETDRLGSEHLGLLVPVWSSVVWEAVGISAVAMVLVFALKWPVLRVLGVCALLGLTVTWLG